MIYTVYKIENLINNKYYIGVHKTTNPNDDYFGSGKNIVAAINKYGKENFKKTILLESKCKQTAYAEEKRLIDTENPLSYNIHPGGHGGFEYINSNKLHINKGPKRGKVNLTGNNRTEAQKNKDAKQSVFMKESFSVEMKNALRERQHILCSPDIRQKAVDTISKRWLLTDPDGNTFEVKNLAAFCKKNNLNQSGLSQVSTGKIKSHNGWLCKKIGA